MNTIVAVDRNWAIGNENRLLCSIPADMKFFRETTAGHVVVMGRKTLESFPGGRPLKKRVNVVITGKPDYEKEGAVIVHSVPEALEYLAQYPAEEVFVIGGDSIYRQMLPYCDTAYVTSIDASFPADTWFPNLEEDPAWTCQDAGEVQEHEGLKFRFKKYIRTEIC